MRWLPFCRTNTQPKHSASAHRFPNRSEVTFARASSSRFLHTVVTVPAHRLMVPYAVPYVKGGERSILSKKKLRRRVQRWRSSHARKFKKNATRDRAPQFSGPCNGTTYNPR